MNDNLGVKMHGVYTRITDKHGFASTIATKKLINWIDKINPDIIHIHCIHGYYLNIQLFFEYLREKNIKIIWTQHDCWAFTGHCAYFDSINCEKWKTGCYDCTQLNTYPASKILDNSKWNWENKKKLFTDLNITIVTPSEWLADLIKQSFLGNYPIEVIYNGIDTSIFKFTLSKFKDRYNIEGKKIILGVASEWTERKGLKDFIKLNNIIDKSKYKIIVVGVNDKQKNKMPKDIIAINRTNNVKELVEIYSSAYVFLNLTYEDNFPTTNLEALACGIPVITYNTGGSGESINNDGFIVKQGDLSEVIKDIEKIKTLPSKKNIKRFDQKTMIEKYLKLYNIEK